LRPQQTPSENTEKETDNVKIVVAIKRVADPDNANKVTIAPDGSAVHTTGLEWKLNPFDEYALEAALRLTENAAQPKSRQGEVLVVTLGPKEAEATLRGALAMGADRALRVDASDEQLDGPLVARALAGVVAAEMPDLVLMGKQTVDGESNQVGQRLAELLDWPMATFAATLVEEREGLLSVAREVDGGVLTVNLRLPAVVTVDLRVVGSNSVRSRFTSQDFRYKEGVRFAPLPAIMAAKKKPLETRNLDALTGGEKLSNPYLRFERPQQRKAGIKVPNVTELVERLSTEAKVL
jgi:electron transfer flavoprotein beta subunit